MMFVALGVVISTLFGYFVGLWMERGKQSDILRKHERCHDQYIQYVDMLRNQIERRDKLIEELYRKIYMDGEEWKLQ